MPHSDIPPASLGLMTMVVGVVFLLTAPATIFLPSQTAAGAFTSFGIGVVLVSQGAFQMRVLNNVV